MNVLLHKVAEMMASLTAPTAKLGSAEQAVVAQLIEAGQKCSQTPVRVTRCFSATAQNEDGSKVVRWVLATPDRKLADLLDEVRQGSVLRSW